MPSSRIEKEVRVQAGLISSYKFIRIWQVQNPLDDESGLAMSGLILLGKYFCSMPIYGIFYFLFIAILKNCSEQEGEVDKPGVFSFATHKEI